MKKFLYFLGEAFSLLLKEPRLFLPKLLVAFLYGALMVFTASLLLKFYYLDFSSYASESIEAVQALAGDAFLWLAVSLAVLLVDVVTSAMYPVMVKEFRQGKKISFRRAFSFALQKFWVTVPAVLAYLLIFSIISFPFIFFFDLAVVSGNFSQLFFSLLGVVAVIFLTNVLFYFIYPVSTLEKGNFVSALFSTVKLGQKDLSMVSKAAVFPFIVSLANFAVAFLVENPAFLALFVFLRFLTALVYSYHLVLNPVIYFEGRI